MFGFNKSYEKGKRGPRGSTLWGEGVDGPMLSLVAKLVNGKKLMEDLRKIEPTYINGYAV